MAAGSATVAFAVEQSFRTLPDIPTWIQPGENITVGSASLENALSRARQPDDPRPDGSTEGNLEGALTVSFDMTDSKFHDLIFPDGNGLADSAARAPTATWYLGKDTIDATEDRFVSGAAVESVSWTYNQGENVGVELTIIYADEPEVGGTHGDAPGSIDQPAKDDIVRHFGTDFDINAASVEQLQSLSLDIAGMARFRRGQQRTATDAVVGAYEPTLNVQANLLDGSRQELAYGSSTATEPLDTVDESSGSLTFSNPAGVVADYDLSRLQPNTYDWQDLVSADTDTTDPVDFHLTDVREAGT